MKGLVENLKGALLTDQFSASRCRAGENMVVCSTLSDAA